MADVKAYRSGESVVSDLFPKGRLQFIHGDTMTVAIWEFEKDAEVPSHVHPHEQIIHCLAGTFEVTVGAKAVVLQSGDTVAVPGGVEHAAFARTPARGVDVFHPVREDYRF
jgi:quercetin dioxygenase-like cupin family protein